MKNIPPEKRELAESNFQVLGITLSDAMLDHASEKLGRAAVIRRGDASTGREQACYVSRGDHDKVFLIFERGEVGFIFYLFADGPSWKGADQCFASNVISRRLATASGLQLGQTPTQVIAILGKPTKRLQDELIHSYMIRKKASPKDLKETRERNHGMSEKDLQANYAYYYLGTGVVAKFADSKLTYLAVSKVESN